MKKILILGGGFGGVFFAKKLYKASRKNFDIELISDNNYFVFQPLLPEVASGAINAEDAVSPLRKLLKGVKFRNAEIKDINLKNRKVLVLQGFRKRSHWIHFDHLVIALGQESNLDIVKGLREHAFTIRNLKDAYNIRNHILSCLELADVTKDQLLKKRLLNFVVIGGGFSGVETIGEIKEMVDRVINYYPNIHSEELQFHIVEYANRLLPELDETLGKYTKKVFLENKIIVHCESALLEVTGTGVYLDNEKIINTNTIISTIGSTVSKLISQSKFKLNKGKIITNENLQVSGYKNIWALGDCALVPNKKENEEKKIKTYAPPTAQFAVRQSQCLADNLILLESQKKLKPFKYQSKGSLASLGSRKGIGKIYGITVRGLFAWIIWRAFYLSFLPSFSTKIRVLLGWMLEFIIPRNAVMTDTYKRNNISYQYYKKGDIVFEEGMIADGFYIVKEGSFKNTYKKTVDGKIYTKIYKPEDHFGSRVILLGKRRTGTIVATQDSKVLKIDKNSFILINQNFPILNEYFSKYLPKEFIDLDLKIEK